MVVLTLTELVRRESEAEMEGDGVAETEALLETVFEDGVFEVDCVEAVETRQANIKANDQKMAMTGGASAASRVPEAKAGKGRVMGRNKRGDKYRKTLERGNCGLQLAKGRSGHSMDQGWTKGLVKCLIK